MDTHTLRSRLVELMQRSRKAMRLYATMGKNQSGRSGASAEFSELQAEEWKDVNADLVKSIGAALDEAHPRKVVYAVLALNERLCVDFRRLETELHVKQKELIQGADNGDFVKAAVAGKKLVIIKARLQATEAAQHELEGVIRRCRITPDPIELHEETVLPEASTLSGERESRVSADPHLHESTLQRIGVGGARAIAVTARTEPPAQPTGTAKVIPLKRR